MIILTRVNKRFKELYLNNTAFMYLLDKFRNFILYDYDYYNYEFKKFKDYYMRFFYYKNKLQSITYFKYSGVYHREDGPAYIEYYNGEICCKQYFLNDEEYSYEDYILKIKKLV